MSKRGLILVEGQTEEAFVKQVLGPYFIERGLGLTPTLLVTRRVKDGPNFKGGVTTFAKFEWDLKSLLKGAGDAMVTTLVDYYGLPPDFPGMDDRPKANPTGGVAQVEAALSEHFNDRRFRPFLSLHEFEAWLFACPTTLPRVMIQPEHEERFEAVCNMFDTPEQINERPGHNPSSRIQDIFTGYRKVVHGTAAIQRIGLATVRDVCPHLDGWLSQLEKFAADP